ncbi:MAG: hypothetical protein O7A69_14750 [SAR324 cluster bacterium]|nr:hypothetical protein [SAR324 cluster bacterium]
MALLLLVVFTLSMDAQAKPRLVFVNLAYWKPLPGVETELPETFVNARKFRLAGRATTQRVMEEWEASSYLPNRRRAEMVRARHNVQLVAVGQFLRYTDKGWLVSFRILDAGPGDLQELGGVEMDMEVYTLLDEAHPVLAPVLFGLGQLFGIPANPAPRAVRAKKVKKKVTAMAVMATNGEAKQTEAAEMSEKSEANKPRKIPSTQFLSASKLAVLLTGQTVGFAGNHFIRYQDDGMWATSRSAKGKFKEQGKWSIIGDGICEVVEGVKEPVCRKVKNTGKNGYVFVLDGGLEQQFQVLQ